MIRVGLGYDVHPLDVGRRLVLGGVEIPSSVGLVGHSDADVLLHAIGDALLGAAALGDLGTHFPPSEERWRGISSVEILRLIAQEVRQAGWNILSIDATVIAEFPRIAPFREQMRQRIAAALGIAVDQVSVKATTNERLGFVGRGEGIAALAVAAIERAQPGNKQ